MRTTLLRIIPAVFAMYWWSGVPSAKAADPADSPAPVHSKEGRFTISMPGTVRQLSTPSKAGSPGLHSHLLMSRLPSTNTLFMTMKIVFRDASAARFAYEETAAHPPTGFTTISKKSFRQTGMQGLDIKMRSDKGLGYGYERLFLDGDALYTLVVESLPGRDEAVQRPMQTFFGSLVPDHH